MNNFSAKETILLLTIWPLVLWSGYYGGRYPSFWLIMSLGFIVIDLILRANFEAPLNSKEKDFYFTMMPKEKILPIKKLDLNHSSPYELDCLPYLNVGLALKAAKLRMEKPFSSLDDFILRLGLPNEAKSEISPYLKEQRNKQTTE